MVESLLSIKRRSQTFYQPVNTYSGKNAIFEIEVNMIFGDFVVWLTNERRLALFPAGAIASVPHHFRPPQAGLEPTQNLSSGMEL